MGRFQRLLRALFGVTPPRSAGGATSGAVDSLVQTFENHRPGLSDETIAKGRESVERFFLEVYERELPRLGDLVRIQGTYLSADREVGFEKEVDAIVRRVAIPAYARLASRFTPRERHDFYALGESLRGVERLLCCVAGMALGAFVVWAPFIPLWSKEWVVPFAVAGLFFPDLRRWLAIRRYETQINEIVARSEGEIQRVDAVYLSHPDEPVSLGVSAEAAADQVPATRGKAGEHGQRSGA